MDSTSVLTTEKRVLRKGNKTPFSMDVAIVKRTSDGIYHRLIHEKTGVVASDRWFWNQLPDSKEIEKKAQYLRAKCWSRVRERYLEKKNLYRNRNDHNHSSFVCYIEAINEIYDACRKNRH